MRLALVLVILACLAMLLFPVRVRPSIVPGIYWVFRYSERTFVRGVLVYEYRANWRYRVANSTGTLTLVLMESDYRVGYRLPDGSWVYGGGEERASFIVDLNTRQYVGSPGYSSWWIPLETRAGDVVPIWSSFLRVTGSAPRLVILESPRLPPYKFLLDCWTLGFQTDLESLTFYYDRSTGFFVYLSFQYSLPSDTVVSGERALVSTNIDWPTFALLQPILMPILVGTSALLILSFAEAFVARARRAGERSFFPSLLDRCQGF